MDADLFFAARFAEGGGHFFLPYARRRVAALTMILLFGAVTHHAVMSDLTLLLALIIGRGFLLHVKRDVCPTVLGKRRHLSGAGKN
jgi:hypothetical protein